MMKTTISYDKIVKGATKMNLLAPKFKYVEAILLTTNSIYSQTEDFLIMMKCLQFRLSHDSWTVIYKLLIVLHILIKKGENNVVLDYLSKNFADFFCVNFPLFNRSSTFIIDLRFVVGYLRYLQSRITLYSTTKLDLIRNKLEDINTNNKGGYLRYLTLKDGLILNTECVQKMIDFLLKNNFVENQANNEILLTSFKLLISDLLILFQICNEAMINLLTNYFEMSYNDACRSLKIYKKFIDQTKNVILYLRVAKNIEHATRISIPTIKNPSVKLFRSLKTYLISLKHEENRKELQKQTDLADNLICELTSKKTMNSKSNYMTFNINNDDVIKDVFDDINTNNRNLFLHNNNSNLNNLDLFRNNNQFYLHDQPINYNRTNILNTDPDFSDAYNYSEQNQNPSNTNHSNNPFLNIKADYQNINDALSNSNSMHKLNVFMDKSSNNPFLNTNLSHDIKSIPINNNNLQNIDFIPEDKQKNPFY